ncbi:MAG: hypothetical protein PHY92_02715 [Alphaproteobacteria bacterium]|nr:hypothetical protein [Alphaproteobacteria bacterium]
MSGNLMFGIGKKGRSALGPLSDEPLLSPEVAIEKCRAGKRIEGFFQNYWTAHTLFLLTIQQLTPSPDPVTVCARVASMVFTLALCYRSASRSLALAKKEAALEKKVYSSNAFAVTGLPTKPENRTAPTHTAKRLEF